MQILYDILNSLLPFDWASHNFMKNALIAILLVTPLFALLGTMIVNNKMAFYSDSLGHSALTGIGIGTIIGLNNPIISMVGFSILFAVIIILLKHSSNSSTDTIIGVFSSISTALGIVILSRGGKFASFTSYLIGDLLSIRPFELLLLFFVFIAVVIIWYFLFNRLLIASINQTLAESKGINVFAVDLSFSIIIAVLVIFSIQWVGILIINSLLILPAAAAKNIAKNMRQYHFFSLIIALCSGIAGLIASYYLETATGATIVLALSVVYFFSLLIKRK